MIYWEIGTVLLAAIPTLIFESAPRLWTAVILAVVPLFFRGKPFAHIVVEIVALLLLGIFILRDAASVGMLYVPAEIALAVATLLCIIKYEPGVRGS